MFNEDLKILVSSYTNTEWSESTPEIFEEMTENKQGQIFVPPAMSRRVVLYNPGKHAKKTVIMLASAYTLMAASAATLSAALLF